VGKSVPVSVRISPEAAAYLAALKIEGCHTVSEKIRHLVRDARLSAEAKESLENDRQYIKTALEPFDKKLTKLESLGHSAAFLRFLSEWIPGVMAMFDVVGIQDDFDIETMNRIEESAYDRVLDLVDHLSRQSLTSETANLNPEQMLAGRPALIELLEILGAKSSLEEESEDLK